MGHDSQHLKEKRNAKAPTAVRAPSVDTQEAQGSQQQRLDNAALRRMPAQLAFHDPDSIPGLFASLDKDSAKFRDWFHFMSNTLTLLSSRFEKHPDSKELSPFEETETLNKVRKLLKSDLMRFQLQATYSDADADRLKRQTSPIVLQGYARGIKTGLWEIARKITEKNIANELKQLSVNNMAREFSVFPAHQAFSPLGEESQIVKNVPKDLNEHKSVYIDSMRAQLFRSDDTKSKNADSAKILRYMGGRGLRTSAGLAAETVADEMIRLLDEDRRTSPKPENGKDKKGKEKKTKKSDNNRDGKIKLSPHDPRSVLMLSKEMDERPVSVPFKKVKLKANDMMAPWLKPPGYDPDKPFDLATNFDPLLHSTQEATDALQSSYKEFLKKGDPSQGEASSLPFAVQENVKVVSNLFEKSGVGRFDRNMPATVHASLTDSLDRASESIEKLRILSEISPELTERITELTERISVHSEQLYQELQNIHHAARFMADWTGDGEAANLLESAVKNMLPEDIHHYTKVVAAPHALAAFNQIQASLPSEQLKQAAILHGAYYETPELFPGAQNVPNVHQPDLQSKRVIVMEPHPNNAALPDIHSHSPVALIENMFAKNEGEPRTLIMDVTLNHLSDDEITETLQKAKPYIDDGRLNLILLQSGTKFMQNGMDLTGIGVGTVINNRRDEWAEFNEKMGQHRQDVAQDDVRYIANMLDANRVELKQYLDKVRDNTSTLRAMLEKKLGGEDGGAIELGKNTDPKTVYLAIKPSDAYVAQVKNKAKEDVTPQDRVDVNQEMYRNDLLPAFENLAAVDRSSFGFNSTNFGETGETIRITLGVEENAMLQRYAQIIAEVSRSIPSRERQA